jgi:hypothetical protein
MAWETRKSGRRYFYLSERLPDGRVHKRYFGNGLRAEVESMRLERKQAQRARRVKKLSRTQSAAFHTIYGVPDYTISAA